MDRGYGEMAYSYDQGKKLLPHSVYEDIRPAIVLLHQHDFVFGDLRPPNIMRVPAAHGAELDEHSHAMLLDFDWVRTHNSSFYSAVMSDALPNWNMYCTSAM